MQIRCLPKPFYTLYRHTSRYTTQSEQLEQRKKCLGDWELLKKRGVPDVEIAKITGISRATYYRRKKSLKTYGLYAILNRSKRPHKFRQSKIPKAISDLVLFIRKQNPTYGKAKISVILQRDHNIKLSQSSVGRLIKSFIAKGFVTVSRSFVRKKRARNFKKHAKRWLYGIKPKEPGQLVQIDHMSVFKNNTNFKHFQAWDPYTKTIVAEVFSAASSSSAKKFLLKAIRDLPFPIQSIQVDGGSEFMQHFEQACADNSIPLYVLPPKRPQYNGGVERANRTMREEFYDNPNLLADSIDDMRSALNVCIQKYNCYRPHHSLQGLTPSEYTKHILQHRLQSHML
jgi:putative transposase